ncbi:U3 snoRNP protein [Boothiomyces macroporosus]|uniref:U3 snoRNP protein n=1 Tax=Boothiomyces macroporosus TaxID=261099 RepID=A0AAD5UB29_9FUNG|nr:U3 snoRNP protein [Boothiomyces macroporosus]
MADDVQYHLEKMLPELQDLQERQKRTDFEYQIHRKIVKKQDYLRYIEFEMNLEKLRKKRKVKYSLDNEETGITLSDYSIVRRIHSLYQQALKRFKGDVSLWIQYFEWSLLQKSFKTLGKQFATAIALHPTKSVFWIMAAKYEYEENSNMTSARVLLQRALRINPHDQKIWLEYFKLELLWIQKLLDRRRILFKEDGEIQKEKKATDSVEVENIKGEDEKAQVVDQVLLNSKQDGTNEMMQKELTPMQQALINLLIPKSIYKNAIKSIPDLEFRFKFIEIYLLFNLDSSEARKEIYDGIISDFPTDVQAIDMWCKRYLDGLDVEDPEYPLAISKAVTDYNDLVKNVPKLWAYYKDFLVSQSAKVNEENLIQYLNILLKKCFTDADESGNAPLEMYHSWYISEKSANALDLGLQKYPWSGLLWNEKIAIDPREEFFEQALKMVKKQEQLSIWKAYLEYAISENKNVDGLFERALSIKHFLNTSDEEPLVLRYLEWKKGFGKFEFRKLTEKLLSAKARSANILLAILDVEQEFFDQSGNTQDLYHINKLWDLIHHVWLKHVKFEFDRGDATRAAKVYWKGTRSVKDVEEFEQRYQQLKELQ